MARSLDDFFFFLLFPSLTEELEDFELRPLRRFFTSGPPRSDEDILITKATLGPPAPPTSPPPRQRESFRPVLFVQGPTRFALKRRFGNPEKRLTLSVM